jgi:hypothetical protein
VSNSRSNEKSVTYYLNGLKPCPGTLVFTFECPDEDIHVLLPRRSFPIRKRHFRIVAMNAANLGNVHVEMIRSKSNWLTKLSGRFLTFIEVCKRFIERSFDFGFRVPKKSVKHEQVNVVRFFKLDLITLISWYPDSPKSGYNDIQVDNKRKIPIRLCLCKSGSVFICKT